MRGVDALRASGHEVGNHYFSIRSTVRASDEEFVTNLVRTEAILRLRPFSPAIGTHPLAGREFVTIGELLTRQTPGHHRPEVRLGPGEALLAEGQR